MTQEMARCYVADYMHPVIAIICNLWVSTNPSTYDGSSKVLRKDASGSPRGRTKLHMLTPDYVDSVGNIFPDPTAV